MTTTVPNVVGLLLRAAMASLSQHHLLAHQISVHDSQPVGTIIAQNPVEGTVVNEASTVDITMSLGPA